MLSAYCLVMASKSRWLKASCPVRYVSVLLDATAPPSFPRIRCLCQRHGHRAGHCRPSLTASVGPAPCHDLGQEVVETLTPVPGPPGKCELKSRSPLPLGSDFDPGPDHLRGRHVEQLRMIGPGVVADQDDNPCLVVITHDVAALTDHLAGHRTPLLPTIVEPRALSLS